MTKDEAYKILTSTCKVYPIRDVELYGCKKEVLSAMQEAYLIGMRDMREKLKHPEPFKGFWGRLYDFIHDVEVCDQISEEEKEMILHVCRIRMPFTTENKVDQP